MGILLSAHELSMSYSGRNLFEKISFGVQEKERIGLIGPNGAGKSTLLKIIAGLVEADQGRVSYSKNLSFAYLEQEPRFSPEKSVIDSIGEKLQSQNPHLEDWEVSTKTYEYASLLGIEQAGVDLEKDVSPLSGGWKKRVALARELVCEPQLLLMDEPTNHLDVEGILWLEKFLQRSSFATITITHDRVFLQRVSEVILELDRRNPNGLLRVDGDYSAYCEIKEALMASQQSSEEKLKNTLRRESEWLRRGAKARSTKQSARIERHQKLSESVETLSERNKNRQVKLSFQGAERNPKKLIEMKNGSKSFAENKIFQNLDLMISRKSRLGLLGSNGSGKSTLIKCLLGQEPLDKGDLKISDNIEIAYFEQDRTTLDPTKSVMESLSPGSEQVYFQGNHIHIRSYLDRFLFSTAQASMEVGKLSGGEQARLLVAQLMLKEANLLVLDEPTNDLDLATLNILEEQLKNFPGAVILVCHDRYFLDQVCDRILAFPEDSAHLEAFADVSQWETWYEIQKTEAQRSKTEAKKPPLPSTQAKKLSYKDQRELESLGPKIEELESQMKILVEKMSQPESPSQLQKLSQKVADLQIQIDSLYARWSELEA